MTTKLSSLRVTAEMDVSQYVRAAAQKVSADGDMVGSAKAVGQALAATDAAASKAVPGVASLSRVWITGYGDAAKFETAVRGVGRAMDRGMDPARAAAALDGIYRKFGQTADAADLAKQGFVSLAPVVRSLNAHYETTSAIADRATAATKRLSQAQYEQAQIRASVGIRDIVPGSAKESASVFQAAFAQEVLRIASLRGQQTADEFTRALNERLISGTGKAARDAASVFSAELDRVDDIARLKGAQAGQEFTRALNERLVAGPGKSASASAAVFQQLAAEAEQEAVALRKLRAEINPLGEAIRVNTENHERYATALAAGHINQEQFNAGVAGSNRTFDLTKRSIDGANVAMGKYANGTGLARHELVNMSRQLQDVFVSLSSGQSPMTVLIQQGTQMADVFSTSQGTVGGFFRQLLTWLGPLVPALAASAAAIAALYSAFSIAGQKQDLSNSLLGVGRAAGVTGEQLNRLAVEAAGSAEITTSSARSIAAEFAKTGRVGVDNLSRLTKLTKDYAATTGQDMGSAAKELATALMDPARGAETLNSKLGFLDSTTARAIRTAVDYGDKLRAQKLLLDAVASSTVAAEQAQSKWNQAWDKYISRPLGSAKEAIGGAVLGPDQAQRVKSLDAQITAIRRGLDNAIAGADGPMQQQSKARINELEARRDAILNVVRAEEKRAEASQKTVESGSRTKAGDDLFKGTQREAMAMALATRNVSIYEAAIEELKKKREQLFQAGDTNGLNKAAFADVTQQIKEQTEGLEKAKAQVKDYAGVTAGLTIEQEKARRVDDLRLKGINDVTPAQRAATAAAIARVEMLGTETTAEQRNEAAKAARRNIDIEVGKSTADATRASNDNVASLEAQTQALAKNGVAAADIARLRQQAMQEANASGEPPAVAFERKMREALADTNKEIALKIAQNKASTSAEQAANAQAKASGQSEIQRSQALQKITALQEQRARLIASGVTDTNALAKAEASLATSIDGVNDAQTKGRALGLMFQQDQTIAALEKEIALVGQSTAARRIELEILQAKQQLQQAGIPLESAEGKAILARAENIGRLNNQLSNQQRLQQQLRQSMDFAADGLKSFVEELLTGTDGINGALKSLGKGFLSASLDALISGKGPLAGITGLAANDNNKQGGILGMLTSGIQGLGKSVEKGAKAGTQTGVALAINTDGTSFMSGGLGISGSDIAGGLTAIAGLAGAYGSGMAASSYGQAGITGAISGAMAGLAIGGPAGAAIGAIIGGGLGVFGQSAARKKAREQREAEAQGNYRQAEPGIATLRSQLRGESQDTLENRIKATLAEVQKGIDVAFFAKKTAEASALAGDFFTYRDKSIADFQRAFGGIIDSMMDGLGPNSAFSQARDNIKSTGEALKGLVSDAAYAFGADSAQVGQAREAAKTHALSILDGAKSLSVVATRMEEIRGAGTALQTLLVELGMSATDAATAIQQDTIAALARLKGAFETDLKSKINDAQGFGYINEVVTLLKEVSTLKLDAASLGTDPTLITTYFQSAAQGIVDSAQLTGDAFNRLVAAFPDLLGNVSEFTNGLKGAAREADIAARILNAQDRLFGATNDNSTLGGQLAAYNRQALREREAEIKAGGEALVDLEQAQAAERYNIVKSWNDKIVDDQKRAADETRSFWERFSKQIKEYTDGLRAGADSPLSPQARLAAAQSQYQAQLVLAQGGDRDALSGITSYSSDLLDAAKAYYASSTGYQDIFASVIAQLEALPDQVSETQLIINAIDAGAQATVDMLAIMKSSLEVAVNSGSAQQIAAALSTYFTQLDTNTSQSIDFNEMKTALRGMASESSLYSMFTRLDVDGSGSLDKLELIKTATGTIRPGIDTTNTSLLALAQISNATQGTANQVALVNANTAAMLSDLSTVRLYTTSYLGFLATISDQTIRSANNLASANTRFYAQGNSAAVQGYAGGGYVSGAGSSTSDSINARLSDGEYVMRAAAVDRFGVGALDQMNDNLRMPAVAMPVMAGGGGQSNAAMLAELRAMRREIAELKAEMARNTNVTAAAGEQVAAHVDGVTSAVKDGSRDKDLLAA